MIYTRRFFAYDGLTRERAVLWVVPADATYILRHVVLGNFHTAAQPVLLQVAAVGGAQAYLLAQAQLELYGTAAFDLRQELHAGETVYAVATLGRCTVLGTGYRFQ